MRHLFEMATPRQVGHAKLQLGYTDRKSRKIKRPLQIDLVSPMSVTEPLTFYSIRHGERSFQWRIASVAQAELLSE